MLPDPRPSTPGEPDSSLMSGVSHLAGLLHRGRPRPVWGASLIDGIGRLGLLLLAWFRIAGDARSPLVSAAVACRTAERALQDRAAPSSEPVTITATGAAQPVAVGI